VSALTAQGADLYASPVDAPGGRRQPVAPSAAVFQRFVPLDTLVFRRATFVDMGGVADRPDDDAEFVYRAACEGRIVVVAQDSTVRLLEDSTVACLGPPPEYRSNSDDSFRHVARGFPKQSVACDVVLPFHGFLDFTREAMESVLSQDNAEVVVHLVDDASPGNTDAFLNYWKSHPQVRAYRNLQNLGQFTSFNNVSQFFETDLAAVQDADDVSLPCRISNGGTLLRLSGAEFFGAAVQLFCDDDRFDTVAGDTSSPESASGSPVRRSFYPAKNSKRYFLENPTAMFRVAMFRRQGGYADFGDPLANRASLDTEFQLRCLYSGVEFAICRRVVTRYRVHQGSATHDNLTGWGTPARRRSRDQVAYRTRIYRNTRRFDPRLFGAIGRHQHLTCRVGGG
jgi:hypothetical protein